MFCHLLWHALSTTLTPYSRDLDKRIADLVIAIRAFMSRQSQQ